MTLDYLSAFMVGLLGSGHCLAMCGGITGMLTTSHIQANNGIPKYHFVISYHLGRLSSYATIGFMVALSASLVTHSLTIPLAIFRLIAAIMIILLGCYIGQWYLGLTKIEQFGQKFWQYLSPLAKKLLPLYSRKQAIGLGILWGWLPCGLVYSMLTWSLASANALQGALIMFCFGLGTLPALLALSVGVNQIKGLLTNPWFKKISAVFLISYGFYSLYIAYFMLI